MMDVVVVDEKAPCVDLEEAKAKTEVNLSSTLPGLTNLDVDFLSLHHNFRPETIRKLSLSRNAITLVPATIALFVELKELDVSTNQITWVSEEIGRLTKLKTFVARNNRLRNLPKAFSRCGSLEVVNLSGNMFEELPTELTSLTRLTDLHLGGNKIVSISPDISSLKRLELLYLGGNQLTDLPPNFKKLKHLRHLYLCDNKLQSIPTELGRLKKLESLSLHKNLIRTLPVEILMLVNLQELTLRDNPLVSTFIKKMEFTPPTLLEMCARTIKTKSVAYNDNMLPRQLINYLATAKKCVNPNCDGVYFDSRVRRIQFMDFCGRFRLPLEQYLCSPNESETDLCIDPSGVDSERLRRVLLPEDCVSTSEMSESD